MREVGIAIAKSAKEYFGVARSSLEDDHGRGKLLSWASLF